MIGSTVGKYRILDRIGRGGMGTVYRAVDDTLERHVAIKVLNSEVTELEALRRFRAEAITLAKLNHPGIATLYDLYQEDGDLLMVMEFVRGETLQKLSERIPLMQADYAANLCAQALDALSYAHRAGIVHRDLKPANLMLTETGIVKVMDFGIARIVGSEHLTSDGFMMGTPAFMAPEQVMGKEVDGRADVYAIGVVLYRLLTGQLPFQADTPIAMAQKQLNEPPVPLSVARPDLPAWCDTVLARALGKAPEDRFQTAEEFRTALLTYGGSITADDFATYTMPTPAGILRDTVGVGIPPLTPVSQASGPARSGSVGASRAASLEAPAAGSTPKAERTVVISGRHFFAGAAGLFLLIAGLVVVTVVVTRRTLFQPSSPATPSAQQSQASLPAPPPAAAQQTLAPLPPPGQPVAPPSAEQKAPATTGAPPPAVSTTPAPPVSPTVPAVQGTGIASGAQPRPAGRDAASATLAKTGTPAGRGTDVANAAAGSKVPGAKTPSASAGAVEKPGSAPAAVKGTPDAVATDAHPADAVASLKTSGVEALPPVTFDNVKLLVIEGDKSREQDAKVRLADGRILLYGPDTRVLASMPYDAVRGLSFARSRQPRWRNPDGTEGDIKLSGGPLGFMKSDRNWLAIATHESVYVMRVDDGSLSRLIHATTQRTGAPVARLSSK